MIVPMIIASFLFFICDIVTMYFMEHLYAKKCGYDCSKCKNWHCQYHECSGKREKLLKEKTE